MLRLLSRVALGSVVLIFTVLVGEQFTGIVAKNIALAHELAASRADLAALRVRTERQNATIRRLDDPLGAVPEIHEKLRLVGPHEEIIYVRGAARPQGADWNAGP
jgi:hypothetical protein